MTTVGYGEMHPVTAGGRVVSMLSGVLGIVLFGIVVWIVTQSLTAARKQTPEH